MRKLLLFLLLIMPVLFLPIETSANTIKLFLTSNLEGQFYLNLEKQAEKDPFLLLSNAFAFEKKNHNADLYLDLGNSFYPGVLSKYNFGSPVMDFFHYTGCKATLISSMDVKIGFENLQFLQKGKDTLLLSSNILKKQLPLYTPYYLHALPNNQQIVFIGLSSSKVNFNISEKKIRNIALRDNTLALQSIFTLFKNRPGTYFILLSGLTHEENLVLLKNFSEIQIIIGGGDNNGLLNELKTQQVSLADGRSLYYLNSSAGYYLAELQFSPSLKINQIQHKSAAHLPLTPNENTQEYTKRLSIWKQLFLEDKSSPLWDLKGKDYVLDDLRMSYLMRYYFKTELALLKRGSVEPALFKGPVYERNLISLFLTDYPFLTIKLTGSQIKEIAEKNTLFLLSGYDSKMIHGYPVQDQSIYAISLSQSAYDRVCTFLDKAIPYQNTWINLTDLVKTDLTSKQKNLQKAPDYLNSIFFSSLNFSFSFYYDQSWISSDSDISTPAGQPEISYKQLGIFSELNWCVYNRWHQLTFTPTINYEEKNQPSEPAQMLSNLLRGTLTYRLNLDFLLKPYLKNQVDTVVKKVDGLRPAIMRETAGATIGGELIQGKLGFGFEKKIQDPVLSPQYGLEFILRVNWQIIEDLTFESSIDFFWSQNETNNSFASLKSQFNNSLAYHFTEELSLSLRYNWFYFYEGEIKQSYSYRQIFTALDVKTDFRLF